MDASGPGATVKRGLAAPIETIARFQAGFLASEDFRRISNFHGFTWVAKKFHGFQAWMLKDLARWLR